MGQTIILVSFVALLGIAGYRALGSATTEGTDCAGKSVEALAAVPCKDGGESLPASVAPPPPPPEAPRADGGDDGDDGNSDGAEVDLKKELLDLFLDITGLNDIKDCVLEGDPLACVMAIASASPIKAIAIAVKLAKNAKRIKNLIDRLIAARKAKKKEAVAENQCKPGSRNCPCFVAGTPVHTQSGWVPIEELKVGDLVLSRDQDTGEEAFRPIAQVFITPDSPVLALSLENSMGAIETIEATPPHPFFVVERGWIPAGDLHPGDHVVSSGGGQLRVASTTAILRHTTVYNFEVADFHTYFVGESAAWVHNDYDPNMFGARGTQVTSQTVFKGQGRRAPRIDVENPNPGQRPGQIHFQQGNEKYLYNPETKQFEGAPRSVNDMLKNPAVQRAIDKAMKILGEA